MQFALSCGIRCGAQCIGMERTRGPATSGSPGATPARGLRVSLRAARFHGRALVALMLTRRHQTLSCVATVRSAFDVSLPTWLEDGVGRR